MRSPFCENLLLLSLHAVDSDLRFAFAALLEGSGFCDMVCRQPSVILAVSTDFTAHVCDLAFSSRRG